MKIKIGALKFRVKLVARLTDESNMRLLNGHIVPDREEIRINTDLASEMRYVVLWHEILHDIFRQYNLEMEQEKEEDFINRLATGIATVLTDNPKLRKGKIKWPK